MTFQSRRKGCDNYKPEEQPSPTSWNGAFLLTPGTSRTGDLKGGR